ncbi:MAG: sodium:proton antiporter, partial [Clostridia bacterium]|nr:sodium:proton antiporter [Clostridia bacterium]
MPSISGLFRKTGLLDGIRRLVERLAEKTNSFTAILCTSIGTSMLACNQSLATMLTGQLCGLLVKDKSEFALALEDSVIILAPLIPWSIAGAVPLASLGAPLT